jgi:hypothetical protein
MPNEVLDLSCEFARAEAQVLAKTSPRARGLRP